MKIKTLISFRISLFGFLLSSILTAEEITSTPEIRLVADNIPPFVFVNATGDVEGSIVTELSKAFTLANIRHSFEYLPWNRGLATLKRDSNVLMYPISRTPEREELYRWITPVQTLTYKLYGLKNTFNPKTLDVTTGDYTFICQETTVLCDILIGFGIPSSSIISSPNVEILQVAYMMKRGRIDFMILSEESISSYTSKMDIEPSDLIPIDKYTYSMDEYLVGNLDVDPQIVEKIRAASEAITIKK